MPGNDPKPPVDPEADFFGDDVDWLDDDDNEVIERKTTPGAPPPPPPFAGPSVLPKDQARAEWDKKHTPPGNLSGADTLIFSDVPTLAGEPSLGDLETIEVERRGPAMVPEDEQPTTQVSEAERQEAIQRARDALEPVPDVAEDEIPREPTDEAPLPAIVEDEGGAETPLVQTKEPAPIRMEIPERKAPATPTITPWHEPRPTLPKFEVSEGENNWRMMTATLITEASVAGPEERGELLFRAGWIFRHRLGDMQGARSLYQDALTCNCQNPALHRELADVALHMGRWEDAAVTLHERATLLDGVRAAESLRECAVLYLRRLQQPGEAVGRLWDSLGADPTDYASLVLLRDTLSDVQPERAEILERIANTTAGPIAAEAWCERGRLLESTDPGEAAASYRRALEAHPDQVQAFVFLTRSLGALGLHEERAALYEAEAERDPVSAGWWLLLAGRDHVDAGAYAKAEAAFTRASADGWAFAAEERQARLFANGAWEPLATTLARQAERATGGDAAATWFRVGWVHEAHLDDAEAALAAYRSAVAADPRARPARDAVRRLLMRAGDSAALLAYLEEELGQAEDAEVPAMQFRAGEVAELAGDHDKARTLLEACLAGGGAHQAARAALCRVLLRLGDTPALVEALTARAAHVKSPEVAAHFLFSAAVGGALVPGEGAFTLLSEALENQPDHLPSLELLGSMCTTAEQWSHYARALERAAAVVVDVDVRVHLSYLAGRIHAVYTGDLDAARQALGTCLELDNSFAPARNLGFDLAGTAGDTFSVCAAYRAHAERSRNPAERSWLLFAAAVMTDPRTGAGRTDLEASLGHHPDHDVARALLAEVCLATDDRPSLIASFRGQLAGPPTTETARVSVRLAELLLQEGREGEATGLLADIATQTASDLPLRPAARLARMCGATEAEAALLKGLPEAWARVERAAILARRRAGREEAREIVQTLLNDEPGHLDAALVASRVGSVMEDPALMATGQAALARHGEGAPMRVANALWAAEADEQLGRLDEARALFELALELQPSSERAALGVARCLIAAHESGELLELARGHELDPMSMSTALSQLDAPEGAIALLRTAARSTPALPALLQLEAALEKAGDWQGAYDTLVKRGEVSRDEAQRASIERKRRWVLSEKLPASDEAWNVFQQLHEEHPSDREITEALARIAGARKQTDMAITFLTELAGSAATPEESARYGRRVAEAHLSAGNRSAARQAYLDALDYAPSDRESLDGLKAMATEEEDWTQLVQILEREAGLAEPGRLIELRREIALVHEERIGNAPVAIDAWRVVLEHHPQDLQALDHLLALSEAERQWPTFIEMANIRAALSVGGERTSLLRRIGEVSADQLHRDDAVRYFERAIGEEPPDFVAAQRLEEHFRGKGDWKGVARALDVQGRVGPTEDERVQALERAAELELERRHDREAAASVYARLLEIAPGHEDALRFMASHLFESGRFDEALPVCERLEPVVENGQDLDDFDTRMELAQFYFYFAEMLRLAEEDGALARYEKALELNATHLASLEAVGPLLCAAGKWKKAEGVYRQLLQLSGGQGERHKVAGTYTQLGLVELALGHAEKAKKRFNKALEIYPNHVDALKGMAKLLEEQEDWSNLLNIYNNVIYHASVAEDVVAGYMTKGRILDQHMSRPDKAAQHYHRSLEFKADQPFAYLRLAELAMRKGDYEGASQLASKALRVDSEETDEVRALLFLCQAAARAASSRMDDASMIVEQARALPEGAWITPEILGDLEGLQKAIQSRLPRT